MNKVNISVFRLPLMVLLATGAANSFAMQQLQSAWGTASDFARQKGASVVSSAKNAAAYVHEVTKPVTNPIWENVLKPYPVNNEDAQDISYYYSFACANNARTSADNAYVQADSNNSNVSKAKARLLDVYASLREFPLEHGKIGNAVWYTGLAAVAAGTTYGIYKLYRYFRPANEVKGPFDIYRTIAKQVKEYSLETISILGKDFTFAAQLSRDDKAREVSLALEILKETNGEVHSCLLSYIKTFEEALKEQDAKLIEQAYKILNEQINIANSFLRELAANQAKEHQNGFGACIE